jgi:hypothetical protein
MNVHTPIPYTYDGASAPAAHMHPRTDGHGARLGLVWVYYRWGTAVQLHALFLVAVAVYLGLSVRRGASVQRLAWAWWLAGSGFVAAMLVAVAQGLAMRYVIGASMRYFAGELRPLALYGPWAAAGAPAPLALSLSHTYTHRLEHTHFLAQM